MYSSVLLFLSGSDLMLIMFIALLLFGGDKLPEIARGLGKGIRDFKDASEGVKREINNQINSYEEKKAEQAAATAAPIAELPPAAEHVAATEMEMGNQNVHNVAPPVETTYEGVANTMPFVENHTTALDTEIKEGTVEASEDAKETQAEPIKTTHELSK